MTVKISPYNPLDKINLGKSVAQALLAQAVVALAETAELQGAGVYAIYYTGPFPAYEPIVKLQSKRRILAADLRWQGHPQGRTERWHHRRREQGNGLRDRLRQHAASIEQANNLELQDFYYRCLVVDDIWIPFKENMLIETFKPIWNIVIDGFGNKDPGNRRATQYRRLGIPYTWQAFAGEAGRRRNHAGRSLAQTRTLLCRPAISSVSIPNDEDEDDAKSLHGG